MVIFVDKNTCCILARFRVVIWPSKVLLVPFLRDDFPSKFTIQDWFGTYSGLAHTHTMSSPDSNGDKIPNHGSGHLEISEKGFGFLRTAANHFHPKPTDIFVTPDTIRRNFCARAATSSAPRSRRIAAPARSSRPWRKSTTCHSRITQKSFASRTSRALTRLKNFSLKPRRT